MGERKINPWADGEELLEPGWEVLELGGTAPDVKRLRIPGGWLYLVGKHPPLFVPE